MGLMDVLSFIKSYFVLSVDVIEPSLCSLFFDVAVTCRNACHKSYHNTLHNTWLLAGNVMTSSSKRAMFSFEINSTFKAIQLCLKQS